MRAICLLDVQNTLSVFFPLFCAVEIEYRIKLNFYLYTFISKFICNLFLYYNKLFATHEHTILYYQKNPSLLHISHIATLNRRCKNYSACGTI